MSLAVIIVNFRTPSMTLHCLRSIESQITAMPKARVILVDNGSNDGSVERFREHAEHHEWTWLQIIALPDNIGFAAGNNRGLLAADDADHVLFLNSDTIVHDNCLAHCVQVMREDSTLGAMSCLLLNRDGTAQITARRFSPPTRQFICALGLPWRLPRVFGWADPQEPWDPRTEQRDVDWVGGAFMLCRADALRSAGGFDEDFFFYGEDYELCHRIRRAGFRIRYDSRASITHLGGGSSDATRLPSAERMRHMWRGRYLTFRKCHGSLATWTLRGLDLLNYAIVSTVGRLRGRVTTNHVHNAAVFTALCRRL